MLTIVRHALTAAAVSSLLLSSTVASAEGSASYYITVTNMTNSINFTPVLVTSHGKGVSLYEPGSSASDELTAITEGGDIAPLTTVLQSDPRVVDVQNSGGLPGRGESVTVAVSAKHGARHISLASMMLPTNDGFIALDNVEAPRHGTATCCSPGFDAGSEPNDELCNSIPVPTCGGEGLSPAADGEG